MDSARLASLLAVSVVNVFLALAVYVRDPRNRANRSFARTVSICVAWLGLAFLSDQSISGEQALLLNRLTFAASMLMGVSLVHFSLVFPSRRQGIGAWWWGFLSLGGLIGLATAATPFVVRGVEFRAFGTNVLPGTGLPVYEAWLLAGIVAIAAVLIGKYRVGTGREKVQLKYVFLAVTVFAVTSVTFGLLLPLWTGSYEISLLNTFTPLALFGFISYAMIKHRLMDMRVVVVRGVIHTILVAAFAVCFLALARGGPRRLFGELGMSYDAAFVLVGLAAVFAFQPLRSLLETTTDKVFFRKRYDQRELLQRLSEQLVSATKPAEMAAAVTLALTEQVKSGMVVFVHPEGGRLVAYGEGIDADDLALPDIIAASPDGRPMLAEEWPEDSEIAGLLEERGIDVVAPLVSDGCERAALLLGEKRSGEVYTEHDMRFLQMLLPEFAIALRTAELLEQRDQRIHEITALNQLAATLGQDIQLDALLNRALNEVLVVAEADGGSVMLLDQPTETLSVGAAQGLSPEIMRETRVALGEGVAGWVALHRTSLIMLDEGAPLSDELRRSGVRSSLSAPLLSHERVIGVLNLSRSDSAAPFTQQTLTVVMGFATQLAVAIENVQLYSDLEGHMLGTITALAAAVEAKDPYTFGHSSQVTELASAIAAEMDLDPGQAEMLRMASILHDVGKIGIDGSILNKPGPLNADEFEAIKRHPEIAANILKSLDFLEGVVPIVLHHHERFDGKGYPAGIAGTDIPLCARIICVADSYDAMTSDRTYRKGMSPEEATEELRRNSGTQFDPAVVAAYLRTLKECAGRGPSRGSRTSRAMPRA